MRVIAGKAKGKYLKSPKGVSLRPTSDLVRGAILSILESSASDWSSVLDLYAGTGSLGIEALSRGAQWADFVEHNPRCCAIIEENLKNTELASQAHVYCCSAAKALSFLKKEYGIILLGPPYAELSVVEVLERLSNSALVGAGSTIVVEHSRRLPLSEIYGDFQLAKEYRHGDTCISVYR
ncbi:MAG: 16S rRNA (guanine(966)-N(2))-methyltransferase RsmD [Candidatus Binatia bacterium]